MAVGLVITVITALLAHDWIWRHLIIAVVPTAAIFLLVGTVAAIRTPIKIYNRQLRILQRSRDLRIRRTSSLESRADENRQRADLMIENLRKENESLRVRPYDDAHKAIAKQKLDAMPDATREVLNFVLHHAGIEVRSIQIPDAISLASKCFDLGFFDRQEDRPGNEIVVFHTYYTVKETWRPILEDLFYPPSSAIVHT